MKVKLNIYFLIISIILISSFGFAQQKSQLKPFDLGSILRSLTTNPAGKFSLLGINPNNFTMQHSYEMSFFSFGGKSITQAIYLNTLKYKISDPLSFTFQWGVHHQPFGGLLKNNISSQGAFISGAELKYKPNDKLMIKLQYRSYPNGVISPYYYNRYYYDRFGLSGYHRPLSWWEDEE